MLNSTIEIVPFKEEYQQEVDWLIETISKEFLEPISTNNINKTLLPHDFYLVAVDENKVVGTLTITRLKNNNSVLRKMFLHKNYRGQGIAQLLLQNIIDWALSNNSKTIYLGTMTQFKTAQIFYEKNYFERISIELLPKDFPINPLDNIFYKLNLTHFIK